MVALQMLLYRGNAIITGTPLVYILSPTHKILEKELSRESMCLQLLLCLLCTCDFIGLLSHNS